MTNKRDLKAFVRYDGSGRVVAGSLILRRQMPKVGKWKEIQGYQCCNQNQTPVQIGSVQISTKTLFFTSSSSSFINPPLY